MTLNRSYDIYTDPKLQKYIRKNLPAHLKKVLNKKLKYLADNPSHPSLNTKQYSASGSKLRALGIDDVYEFYINKSYRCVLYIIHSKKCVIIAYVGSHEQVKAKYS